MIGPISSGPAKKQDSNPQQQEIVLLELEPRFRWPRYTFLLVLVGILGASIFAYFAYFQMRPVRIGEIVDRPGIGIRCNEPIRTWGVTVAHDEAPGFEEIDGERHGYWLYDKNELGIESEIAVFYDPAKIPDPAVGQSLKVGGVLECNGGFSPERLAIREQLRIVE